MSRLLPHLPGRAAAAAGLLLLSLAAASRPAPHAAPAHRAAHTAPRAVTARAAAADSQAQQAKLFQGALDARKAEDAGACGDAMRALRALRPHVPPDADLELWLALDEARCGESDSAWARLDGPLLTAAAADTLPVERYIDYGERRPLQWFDGRFTGWHWYVVHARAELALERGDWNAAVTSARAAVRAQPLLGREHLLLAVAAGRAGDGATARAEAVQAAALDPLLPEASYLAGLWAWRDGNRVAARAAFEAAIGADSSCREAALALVRLRLPGSHPDSLPAEYLTGERRAAMLTARERPKPEELVATDTPAGLYTQDTPALAVSDSAAKVMRLTHPVKLIVTVLVDEKGRPALSFLPYLAPQRFPAAVLEQVMHTAAGWHFKPATRFGQPVRAWISVEYLIVPPASSTH